MLNEDWKFLTFRIPVKLLNKVDEARETRECLPRVAWILEAIKEKLKRDKKHD